MKKKLLSIIICLCMCFSFLTGCTLTYTDNSYKNDDVVMTVGNSEITYEDLVSQYNNFYSQYYQYFMYYDSNQMIDMFYNAVIDRAIVLEKANELLNDTTKNDRIKFYTEDYDDIWNNIYDFINAQLDTREKALLLQSGLTEKELPARLQEVDNDEKPVVFKDYESKPIEKPDYSKDADTAPAFNDKYAYLKNTAIYTYNAEKDAEKDRDTQNIKEEEKLTRTVAFNQYIETLIVAAKAAGEKYDLDSVLKAEVERLYKTYYESELYSKYQEYVEGGIVDTDKLSRDAIVSKFIELTNKDTQNNANQEKYVELVTKNDSESLILYHNGGEHTYFTVQHLLVKYDYETQQDLKQHVGYLSTINSIYRNEYNEYREALVDTLTSKDLSDNDVFGVYAMETSYRDSEGYLVKETVGEGDDAKKVLVKVTVQDILNEYNTELAKISNPTERDKTMLFNKLAWKYSDDTGSLNDKLSSKLGFTITDEVDNHGSFVVDFTNGARALFENYDENDAGSVQIGEVLTDYGLHLMMVTGKYEAGALVEIINTQGDNYKDFDEIETELKSTYVSNMTNQTLYEYVYDIIKDTLVGTNGKYFVNHKNSLVEAYDKAGKIKDNNRLSYEELSKAIGA